MDDKILLPEEIPDSLIGEAALAAQLPVELAKDFSNCEIFEIKALDNNFENTPSGIHVVSVGSGTVLPKGWKSIPVRQLLVEINADLSGNNTGKMLRALHIARWIKESRFCGTCGCENLPPLENMQRTCPNCGKLEFPRICPAVITIITDDQNRILLAHNKNFRKGLYSHIAGFNEAGESLEETVAREIYEEINITVKDIVYIRSQPWPFPNSLMTGFKARYSSGTIRPDGIEIEDAGWFNRDNMPELPGEGSLSRFLINRWLDGTPESRIP